MSTQQRLIVVALIVSAAAALDAQGTATLIRQRQGVTFAESWRPIGAGQTRVIGHVIDILQTPVSNARVQLRNLLSGSLEGAGATDANGEYTFTVDNPGSYVVEVTMVDGFVVALSNAGALARYETLQTVVTLPGRWDGPLRGMVTPRHATNFVGMSAATTMTAQTVQIALEQSIQPVDSGEPVSPFKP